MTKAYNSLHSAEFWAEPWNLGFYRGIEPQNFAAEVVFIPQNFRGISCLSFELVDWTLIFLSTLDNFKLMITITKAQ